MALRLPTLGVAVLVVTGGLLNQVRSQAGQGPAQGVTLTNLTDTAASKRLHLPVFQPFEYGKTPRDPFIDPSILATLLGAKKQDVLSRPKPIDDYAGELQRLLDAQYPVQGIAYDPGVVMALMGGRVCRVGEKITLKINSTGAEAVPPGPGKASRGAATQPQTLQDRLYATSRYWGLNLEHELHLGQLHLTIRAIGPEAVYLKVPGATQEFVLAYAKRLGLDTADYASAYGPPAPGSATKPRKTVPASQNPAAKPAVPAK